MLVQQIRTLAPSGPIIPQQYYSLVRIWTTLYHMMTLPRGSPPTFMDKVILEVLKKIATNVEDNTEINCTSISKAKMSGEFYSRSIALIGENVAMPELDGDPSIFWINFLGEKSPCWSSLSKPLQSSHKILQNIEEPAKLPAEI